MLIIDDDHYILVHHVLITDTLVEYSKRNNS